MSRILFFMAFLGISIQSQAYVSLFKYDEKTHKCVNREGKEGLNGQNDRKRISAHLKDQFKKYDKTKRSFSRINLECWDLSGVDLRKEIGKELAFSSTKWPDTNLRGANFENAKLPWAHLTGDFRGTNFKDMQWGYVSLKGMVDEKTILPKECVPKDGKIDCMS